MSFSVKEIEEETTITNHRQPARTNVLDNENYTAMIDQYFYRSFHLDTLVTHPKLHFVILGWVFEIGSFYFLYKGIEEDKDEFYTTSTILGITAGAFSLYGILTTEKTIVLVPYDPKIFIRGRNVGYSQYSDHDSSLTLYDKPYILKQERFLLTDKK